MELLTKEMEETFPKLQSSEGKPEDEIQVLAHYFSSSWDWWATEYDTETRTFFGLVRGFEVELGYFTLAELEENSCNVRIYGGIERDLYWRPKSLKAVRDEIEIRR